MRNPFAKKTLIKRLSDNFKHNVKFAKKNPGTFLMTHVVPDLVLAAAVSHSAYRHGKRDGIKEVKESVTVSKHNLSGHKHK